jgi:hypothetical protein
MLNKTFVYFIVPWDRLLHSIFRVKVNIMSRAVSEQNTTYGCYLPDQVLSFHNLISFT